MIVRVILVPDRRRQECLNDGLNPLPPLALALSAAAAAVAH